VLFEVDLEYSPPPPSAAFSHVIRDLRRDAAHRIQELLEQSDRKLSTARASPL